MGLSLGAQITVTLLATAPEIVDHAICSGTNTRGVPGRSLVPWSIRAAWPLNRYDWFVRANLRAAGFSASDFAGFAAEARATTAEAVVRVVTESLDFRVPAGLERVTAPVLLIAGEREARPVRVSLRELAAMLNNREVCSDDDTGLDVCGDVTTGGMWDVRARTSGYEEAEVIRGLFVEMANSTLQNVVFPPASPPASTAGPRCHASTLPQWKDADGVMKKKLLDYCRAPADSPDPGPPRAD